MYKLVSYLPAFERCTNEVARLTKKYNTVCKGIKQAT